jgi:hypothetical protein
MRNGMKLENVLNAFGVLARDIPFVVRDGYIRAIVNGKAYSPVVALAQSRGINTNDNLDAAGKLGISASTLNTLQNVCELSPKANPAVKQRVMAMMDPTHDFQDLFVQV